MSAPLPTHQRPLHIPNRPLVAASRVGNVDLTWHGAELDALAILNGPDTATALTLEPDAIRLAADAPAADPRPRWDLSCASDAVWQVDHRGRDGDFVLVGDDLRLAEVLAVVQRGNIAARFNTTHADLTALALRTISGGLTLSADGHFSALQEAVMDVTSGRLQAELDGWFTTLGSVATHLTSGSGKLALVGRFVSALQAHIHINNATLTLDLRGQFDQPSHVFVQSKASIITVVLDVDVPTRLDLAAQAISYRATNLHWHNGAWYTSAPPHPPVRLTVTVFAQSGDLSLLATDAEP